MNKDSGVELFCRAPNRLKRGIIKIQRVDASGMRICIHMRADLSPAQPQFTHASFEFACCEVRILHWNRRQTRESFRMSTNGFRDVVIESTEEMQTLRWIYSIAKNHRNGREHLHGNAFTIALIDPLDGIPNIVGNPAKQSIANHHSV